MNRSEVLNIEKNERSYKRECAKAVTEQNLIKTRKNAKQNGITSELLKV